MVNGVIEEKNFRWLDEDRCERQQTVVDEESNPGGQPTHEGRHDRLDAHVPDNC